MFTNKTKKAFIRGVITKKAPLYVQFAVEKNCNFKCQMCDIVKSRGNEETLNLTQIEEVAFKLNKMGVAMIILTGGEPLLRQDISDIVAIFTKHGIQTRIQTNGSLLTEEVLQKLIGARISGITVSLDSLIPEKQDSINQKKDSWNKVVNAIALMSKMLPTKGVIPGVNTVVSKFNLEEIPSIINFVTEIGFYSSLIPAHVGTEDNFLLRKNDNNYRFEEKDFNKIDDVFKKVINMKSSGYHVYNTNRFLRETPDFLKFNKVHWKCDSPFLYFSISPSGKFLPCLDINSNINLLEDDFLRKFKSGEVASQLRKDVEKCKGCMYACYPEVTYFCRDWTVLSERIVQSLKMKFFTRKRLSNEKIREIATKHSLKMEQERA